MRKPSKNSIDYYMLPNKMMCSSVGMWPFDEEPSTWKAAFARFRLIFSVLGICVLLTPEIMFLSMNWGDLKILTLNLLMVLWLLCVLAIKLEVGFVVMTLLQMLFKMIYLLARRKSTYRLYEELRSLWDSSNDTKERDAYEMFANWARIGSITFYFSVISTALIYISSGASNYIKAMAIGNSSGIVRHLPLDSWYGMDVTESPIFEIAFVSQVVAMAIGTSTMCGIVTTCGMTILHISGQFRLISVWITDIGIEINREKVDYLGQCPPSFEASLTKCIRHHQRLIHLVDEVNNLLTPIIFIHLLTSGVEICLSGFALLNNPTSMDLLKLTGYLISMMIQSMLWCIPGEILIHENRRLSYTVYLDIPWYKLSPVYQRHLVLMILRAQRYCSISTVTFEALSIHTLTSIFNTAASYFALLQRMQEKALSEN